MAKPLHQLTKKGEAWKCTEDEWKAFEELKRLITSTPILVQPDQSVQFWLETDASSYATGAVLVRGRKMASGRVHIQKPFQCREELRDP